MHYEKIYRQKCRRFSWLIGDDVEEGIIKNSHERFNKDCAYSGKDVTILKLTSYVVIFDEPLIVFLKYAIGDTIAEGVDECI